MLMPHSTMSAASTGSSAFHLRCRCSTRTRWSTINPSRARARRDSGGGPGGPPPERIVRSTAGLFHLADELEDLHGVRTELLRELVLDRLGRLHESGLVDTLDDLDADALELGG